MILGLYGVDPQDDLALIADSGIDVIHQYYQTQPLSNAIAYLDAAQAAGLRVVQNMPVARLTEGDAFWIGWVTTLSAHPALHWWYMPEEPTIEIHEPLVNLYQLIKTHDPNAHPAVLYGISIDDATAWCDTNDVIMSGAYPSFHNYPRAGQWIMMEAMRQGCSGKPIIGVLEFFDPHDYGVDADPPTAREMRFDAYSIIIAGITDLMWYTFNRGWSISALRESVLQIVQEIRQLESVIESSEAAYPIFDAITSGPETESVWSRSYATLQTLRRTYNQKHYLLACNLSVESITAQFSGVPLWMTEIQVLFEDRTIAAFGGVFSDSLTGYDVHIYQWGTEMPIITDLQTVEANLRQKAIELIAQADAITQVIIDLQVLDDQLDAAAGAIETE